MLTLNELLDRLRHDATSLQDQGHKFELICKAYFLTDPLYAQTVEEVWLWSDFFAKKDFGGGNDVGIDLVIKTYNGDYWAAQAKFFDKGTQITKSHVDTFISTSSRTFRDQELKPTKFAQRIVITTTGNWTDNALESLRNQDLPHSIIGIEKLKEANIDWGKLYDGMYGEQARTAKKERRPHQTEAIDASIAYYQQQERGKLIMACGTGKTYTALQIAEELCGKRGVVLFLVPSIALLGQTLREWSNDAVNGIKPICICSDPKVGVARNKQEDTDLTNTASLAYPASTNIASISNQFKKHLEHDTDGMIVVFSTYQSIQVIADAQRAMLAKGQDKAIFDLIICDEAHRTTGVTLANTDESAFVMVHDNNFIRGKKRLYMTATPRMYGDETKTKAKQMDAVLTSMDDEKLYGQEIYRIGFGNAVEQGLLSDYKVLILSLSEHNIPGALQKVFANQEGEISTDDASKLVGCINALSKKVLGEAGEVINDTDPGPMRRAVAFCQSIKVSKQITGIFNEGSLTYLNALQEEQREGIVKVNSLHIDGTMESLRREELLNWLKEESDVENECRILTNVRCLSEGVDVPSLDAVLFLSARNSQVDVVQSVGRVMRKAKDKKYGYIIIPVLVPADMRPEDALNSNERFKVVWTVLNALRAHDDRFNATVNKIAFNKEMPENILVGGSPYEFDGDGVAQEAKASAADQQNTIGRQIGLNFSELQGAIYAKMVEKVGDRRYWEQWAKDVAIIAANQVDRITRLVNSHGEHKQNFEDFLAGLHSNINPSISAEDAIEMLAQHLITKPVFEALFENYSFAKSNPISQAMEVMIGQLEGGTLEKDTEVLDKFYQSVRMRAQGIDNAQGKQRIIIELYDKFFKTAFPRMVERLGIVYTPVEVVDFILHSVEAVLKADFGRSLADENVQILDPFTGTGTFITRLLQSGIIPADALEYKYLNEIHANEIVLLAYYIASVNIENAYHDATKANSFVPFEGICLTDTFQLGEADGTGALLTDLFPKNSDRVVRQKKAPLTVIIGNPPYSVGQKSANDNAQNQFYPKLDSRIADTYVAQSSAGLNKAVYDSYIKAFRWSTDRLDPKTGGIICFVSNGAWLDGNSTEGFRKSIEQEFSSIYVFNLRGNQRTQGELSRKEGGKIFGSGSRTPVAITVLVKKPGHQRLANIRYADIGDYLSKNQKLERITNAVSIEATNLNWVELTPNEHGDWISERDASFGTFTSIEAENKFDIKSQSYFTMHSLGVVTNRDAYVYSFSFNELKKRISKQIQFYNENALRIGTIAKKEVKHQLESEIPFNSQEFSWDRQQKKDVVRGIVYAEDESSYRIAMYRPYTKQNQYFNRNLNNCVYQIPKLFPKKDSENLVICVSGVGVTKPFSAIITNILPDLELIGKSQCFPLYYYQEVKDGQNQIGMFDAQKSVNIERKDGISNFILADARERYGNLVTKPDIFYFVYGFLHNPEYATKYAADLKKMLPRIPLPNLREDFWAYSKAGKKLADLHLNYESVPPTPEVEVEMRAKNFRVEKMRFASKADKSTIHYNSFITISKIPAAAYDYVVNGKSAIDWIMERYAVTTHKESGITNDPNDWATEVGNERYILDLLLSVITVSLETRKIVAGLPGLDVG